MIKPKYEEIIEKFVRALYKAQKWVYDTPSEEVAETIASFFEDTDMEIITSSIERYKSQKSFAEDPILNEEEWNNLQNIMEEAGELPERIDYDTYVNTEFAESILE